MLAAIVAIYIAAIIAASIVLGKVLKRARERTEQLRRAEETELDLVAQTAVAMIHHDIDDPALAEQLWTLQNLREWNREQVQL